MRCCARVSRAPATIFMARVIFCVDLVLVMRLRIVLSDGILRLPGARLGPGRGGHRRAELLERLLEKLLGLRVQGLLRAKVFVNRAVLLLDEIVETTLISSDLRNVELVDVTSRPGKDDDHLPFDRKRSVL